MTPLGTRPKPRPQRRRSAAWICASGLAVLATFITSFWAQNYHPDGPACIGEDWQGSLRPYGVVVWLATWAALVAIYWIGSRRLLSRRPAADRWTRALTWLGWFVVVVLPPAWWGVVAIGNEVGCGGI